MGVQSTTRAHLFLCLFRRLGTHHWTWGQIACDLAFVNDFLRQLIPERKHLLGMFQPTPLGDWMCMAWRRGFKSWQILELILIPEFWTDSDSY